MTADPTLPAGYPSEWELNVALRDGTTIRMRPILPEDADGLQDMMSRMSRQTVYHRFFQAKDRLEPEELEAFTNLDYRDRMALVAIRANQIIGVGRYWRDADNPEIADVAFAVVDAEQGKGIATRLVRYLTTYAVPLGIGAFRASVLADNHVMIRVFRNAGYPMRREPDEGLYKVEFPTVETPFSGRADEIDEQRAIAASLMPVFFPSAVAVIGASREPNSIGGRLFTNLINGDFTGPVFPVNPKANVVRSVKAYNSILEVPGRVDLAFIVVPSRFVNSVVAECVEKGVRGLVVISAGFSETGESGAELEDELMQTVRDAGMRMVGPNCMGLINMDSAISMNGQFGPLSPPAGNVAMSSQSGALGIAILDYATQLNIGISTFVSIGNQADISGDDLLLYWESDPGTDVILLYMESFGNPRRFARAARRIAKKKPIVAVKSGRTAAGARAASSHTGSLASLDVAVDTLFKQSGVIRTDTLTQLFDVTSLVANQPLPRGSRVAILTNAGGPGILAVDALEANGLEVVEFSDELKGQLRGFLADDASVTNPVDMIASAGPVEYAACIDLLLNSDEIDALMTIFIPAAPEGAEEMAIAIRDAAFEHHGEKTFLIVYMSSGGAPRLFSSGAKKIPTYPFPEQAAFALSRAVEYDRWRQKDEGAIVQLDGIDATTARQIVDAALVADGVGWLDPDDVEAVLGAYGLAMPKSAVVATADEAVAQAAAMSGPVVLKVISESALHKSDVGGVVLDVEGDQAVRDAYAAVTGAVPDADGALVQQYVEGGHEVLIGMTEDPNFGPLIVFGLGGVFVELIGDVSFRIHPLTDIDAAEMITEVKSAQLLAGYRGGPAGDIPAVEEALLRVSALIADLPEIVEMDMNPVKVAEPGKGLSVVDARIRVRPVTGAWLPSRRDLLSEL
ncbi:MAG: GNAT family N-acetyltransferase [Acidimicrobiia bacterium]|nr:GNAT family N-acetyltransferase [Acidimicrobiia bacterium]MDX2468840.1 GNAT family N-acetyltransferase [Acidimicrobiia bacterium]